MGSYSKAPLDVDEARDPVAVVGLSFRFPSEAVSEESLWRILRDGQSTMTEVPGTRYNINGHCSHGPGRQDGQLAARGGHYLQGDIAAFDAPFFRMSSAEAKAMDPQLRLLLETTYHAFESTGLSLDAVAGSNTSVYVGSIGPEYESLFAHDEEIHAKYAATGSSFSMLSNRLSWFYDLKGSSVSIDTACSSSLVGLHLACQSLLHGESDMSLVGGVQLQLEPRRMTAAVSRLGFLSADSHCYSFDDRANGYSRGEGVGVLVLKRLSRALADGDTIRAVIRATSTNQDGRTPSITQPSAAAQAALIRKTYELAGLGFEETGYFEAHGTGTTVGDPIEASGISQVFTAHRSAENPLYVGSVKANIGHLEPTAGIAGLIKTILVLEKGVIPPNALLKNLNPEILADEWHLKFPTTVIPWPKDGLRRASVNSFGYGGTNAHAVVDDAMHYLQSQNLFGNHNVQRKAVLNSSLTHREQPSTNLSNATCTGESVLKKRLFLLSAADENGIGRQMTALESYLAQNEQHFPETCLQDLAFTLSKSRASLPWKSFALASSVPELRKRLLDLTSKPVRSTESPSVHFVFTGQGAQWPSMGMDLLRYPVFRKTIEHADACFRSLGSTWSALDELCKPEPCSNIHDPSLAQPLCTMVQIALVDLLASWGIHPKTVAGHSSGEIAAAYCAGGLTRDSAFRVAYFRGECVSRLVQDGCGEAGGMLAVGLSAEDLVPHFRAVLPDHDADALECGCLNSPKSTTVTGPVRYINALASHLDTVNIFSRKLKVPVAYHSRQMLLVADRYRALLDACLEPGGEGLHKRYPVLFSSVTGLTATQDDLSDPDYWVSNLVSQVKFSQALQLMCSSLPSRQQGHTRQMPYLVEIGPHCSLERPIRDTLSKEFEFVYDYSMRRSESSADCAMSLAGRLAVSGYAVDVQTVNYQRGCQREPRMLLDLPKYAFNHSQRYWLESRWSKNVRTREHPRHELLGIRSANWNPLRPSWRIVIRSSDLPWISDHKVEGITLYPAAGMLVMAIEGLRSLPTKVRHVAGYKLRDVNIGSALVVPDGDEGVETQLHMSPFNPTGDTDKGVSVWSFWIHSVTNDEWKLHCSGQISVKEDAVNDVVSEAPSGDVHAHAALDRSFKSVLGRCGNTVNRQDFYQTILEKSVDLGETFRTLHNIHFNEGGREATASLPFGDWRRRIRGRELSEHLIHPTTLDGLLHIPYASVFTQLSSLPSVVPRQIAEVYVSNALLNDPADDTLQLYGGVTELGVFHLKADVTALDMSTEKPLVSLRGVQLLGFQATGQQGLATSTSTSLFHRFEWKPDISLLSQAGIEGYCRQHTIRNDTGARGFDGETELICRHFLSVMLKVLDVDGTPKYSSKPFIRNYVQWARSFLKNESESTSALEKAYPRFTNEATRAAFIEAYGARSPQARDTVEYGKKLVAIVREEVDALGLLFNDGMAERLYQSPAFSLTAHRLAGYMDLLAHKRSDLKILEVGAGTGSTTTAVLDVLASPSPHAARFSQYDFTDISPSFFADAQERYAAHSSRMRFKVFDVERHPEEQGFEPGSYDVVIAAAVLHATSSIEKSLLNVKELLKPGGQLVFWEPTNRRMASIPFFVGVLPGWWLSTETYRSSGPLLNRSEWNEALLRTGFDGLQVSLPDDMQIERHVNSLLVSRTQSSSSGPIRANLSTVIVIVTTAHEDLAKRIKARLDKRSKGRCEILHLEKPVETEMIYDQCISLVDLGKPLMPHLNMSQFEGLRRIMGIATQFIWVTDGCGMDTQNPEAAMMAGFGKSLERERPGLSFVHLNVQTADTAEDTIMRVVDQSHTLSVEDQETDILEDKEEDGRILVPRAVEAPDVNSLLHAAIHGLQPQPTLVSKEGTSPDEALELRFNPGRLDSLHFGPDLSTALPLQDDEVLVLTKATGINFRDVMVALNQIADDQIGAEFAGVVLEVGAAWQSVWTPGDRVCGPLDGSFRTVARTTGATLVRMPPGMSFAEAAAIPVAFATAQYALRYLARIQPGESILIHAAAGGVGQAAVYLAQRAGATVYATVSTPEKKELLMDRFGIEAGRIFSSRHTLFASQILQQSRGRGVDVVLNSLAGQALTESWRCLAHLGRFVEIGKRDVRAFSALPMEPFARNVSFCSLDLKVLAQHNPALLSTIMQEIQAIISEDAGAARARVVPHPLTVFKRSGFEEAFRLLQSGRHAGKVVVDWEESDTIEVIPRSPLDYTFNPHATYVITGGLGGIGRNLAKWMARNGARHLCLLSRSGPNKEKAKALVTALKQDGVHVYSPICDISDTKAVMEAVAHMKAHMPPIKGCIHGAMAIENRAFENYDLASFNSAFPAKIQGTYNLDDHLPHGMDFFVILGSIAAFIGPASQSNYAGASAFQDAFARRRRARGEHCVTIDLGAVEGIGYIAERLDVARNVDMMFVDHKVLRERDVHFVLKWACHPGLLSSRASPSSSRASPSSPPSLWDAQIVAGLTTPAFVRKGGILQDHKWMRIPMFRHLYRMEQQTSAVGGVPHSAAAAAAGEGEDGDAAENAGVLLRSVVRSRAEAADVVTRLLARRLARSLAVPVEDIDVGRPAYAFGVDSLVAVELLFWFSTEVRADVPIVQILGSSTIAQLGVIAASKSEHLQGRDLPE